MLQAKRVFVLEVDEAADGRVSGCVEYVLTGARQQFESSTALVAFIQQVLTPPNASGK